MKKFSFILIAVAAIFVSCSKMETVSTNNEVEYVEVSVKTLIENLEYISETPLTKSGTSSNDLWGIQIFKGNDWDVSYFCAIYDDISLLKTIKLAKNTEYSIYSNYMPNGKIENPTYGTYKGELFSTRNPIGGKVELNREYYGETEFDSLGGLCTQGPNTKTCEYYMFVDNKFVATEGSSLNINYIRANLGIVLNLEKYGDNTYDEVYIELEHRCRRICKTIKLTNGSGVLSIPSITIDNYEDMYNDDYSMEIRIGTTSEPCKFYDGEVTLARNKIRTYSIKLIPITDNTSVVCNYENNDSTTEDMGSLN